MGNYIVEKIKGETMAKKYNVAIVGATGAGKNDDQGIT